MKKIKVKLFGPLREKAKSDCIELTVSPPVTPGKILNLTGEVLNLTDDEKVLLRIASRERYLSQDEEIMENEIYLIPPVGGG